MKVLLSLIIMCVLVSLAGGLCVAMISVGCPLIVALPFTFILIVVMSIAFDAVCTIIYQDYLDADCSKVNKFRKHIRRWNIWRKRNVNGPVHKLKVLFGITKSPTLATVYLPEEAEQITNFFEKIKGGWIKKERIKGTNCDYVENIEECVDVLNGILNEMPLEDRFGKKGDAIVMAVVELRGLMSKENNDE